MDYKKNNINTDREKGRGTKMARVTRVYCRFMTKSPLIFLVGTYYFDS
jgi:hypothetical protein